jgi:hypothetical protein
LNDDPFDRTIQQKIQQSIKQTKMNNKEYQGDGVRDQDFLYNAAAGFYEGYQQGLYCSGYLCMGDNILFDPEVKCGGCNIVVHTMCSR